MAKVQNKKERTVLWWVGWIVLTILSFFISCYFWTGFIARHIGSVQDKGVSMIWVTAVFGTWMVLLVPLIIGMYAKVDKAYEDARNQREDRRHQRFLLDLPMRAVDIPADQRQLPEALSRKLRRIKPALKDGHLVTLHLKDGRRISNAFIFKRQELVGLYDAVEMPFLMTDLADLEASDLNQLPRFEADRWLRLDGVGKPI